MRSFVTAWIAGIGIYTYGKIKYTKTADNKPVHAPPGPGKLIYMSGAFMLLAALGEIESARRVVILVAWGIDIAAFVQLFNVAPGYEVGGGGPWPPAIAPNNVVIPTGITTTTTAQTSPSSSTGTGTGTGATLV